MTKVETNTRRIIDRLKKDGWTNVGGGSHDRFVHEGRPETMITVPRHRELSPGVARSIAKAAGWI
jgi:predicted RNA binding protein YcfA (HicA-like mRNA interferase family)